MSEQSKQQRYLAITRQIVDLVGGQENIVASTHCATRLRIVLKDYEKADREKIEDVDLVKGQFIAGNQLQIIFGAGLVNDMMCSANIPALPAARWPRSKPLPPKR